MIFKKKLSVEDRIHFLTHGGREKISREALEAYAASPHSPERRNFLKKLAAATTGFVLTPSIFEILSRKVLAESGCEPFDPTAGESSRPPVIELHARGGDHYAADIAVGLSGSEDLLSGQDAYILHGMPQGLDIRALGFDNAPQIGGIRFHNQQAALYRGLNDNLLPGVKDHLGGMVVCASIGSDTDQVALTGTHLYPLLGRTGTLNNMVGNRPTPTGGSYQLALGPRLANSTPYVLRNRESVLALGGLGILFDSSLGLANDRAMEILRVGARMSERSLAEFTNLSLSDQVKELVRCGYIQSAELPAEFSEGTLFDDASADLATAFGGNPNQSSIAAVSHAVLSNFAGFGACTDFGHDPHDGSAQAGWNARNRTGRLLAQILNYAHLRSKPVFVIVLTDGAMRPANQNNPETQSFTNSAGGSTTETRWAGDSDRRTLVFGYFYHPNYSTSQILRNTRQVQIGGFDANGVIHNSAITTQVQNVPLAFAYNYLSLLGQEDEIADVSLSRGNPFEGPNEEIYRIFRKLGG
ncbi:MAG: winged helix-turn-helix domain-containing protein [Bradymonadales bacterium]|nr:MAG: winged helix-turn-helix domain-containing protein [Bradymonadales bacterium]